MINPFTREPSQRFKEVFGGKSLAYVLLLYAIWMDKKMFLEGFDLKLEKDASLVCDEIVDQLNHKNVEKWCKWLERPRKKWGDSPLEKALANIFIPFLAVT